MRLRNWIFGAASALTMALAATSSYAAPTTSMLNAQDGNTSAVQKAAYRCWYSGGVEQCRWIPDSNVYGYEPGGFYPGNSEPGEWYPSDADHLPPGSRIWWDQMEREGRTGRPN